MGKFVAGVYTTMIIIFTIYAFKTGYVPDIGLAFFYFMCMTFIYGVNFGMTLEREVPRTKKVSCSNGDFKGK